MIECLQDRGIGTHAGWRGRDRIPALPDSLERLGRGDRVYAPQQLLTAPTSSSIGGMSGARNLPEFAGETFVYAFADPGVGRECRRRFPGLMVAINWCDDWAGRITPDAIANTDQET